MLTVMQSVRNASVRHRARRTNAFDLLSPDDHGGKLIASTVSMLGTGGWPQRVIGSIAGSRCTVAGPVEGRSADDGNKRVRFWPWNATLHRLAPGRVILGSVWAGLSGRLAGR